METLMTEKKNTKFIHSFEKWESKILSLFTINNSTVFTLWFQNTVFHTDLIFFISDLNEIVDLKSQQSLEIK